MSKVWFVLGFPFRAVMFLLELIATLADWIAERKKEKEALPLTPGQNEFFRRLHELRQEKANAIEDPVERAEWNVRSKKVIEEAKKKAQLKK